MKGRVFNMKEIVDAKGEACPRPVIKTKNKLDSIEEGIITTIVDNEIAKENVSKLANSLGYEYRVDKKNEQEYHIHIIKGTAGEDIDEGINDEMEDMTIAFASNTMGEGSEELGKILMNSFIYTVTEVTPYPSTLIFYNGGVHLTCEGSEALEDLKQLEEKGVKIIACGTCLDFFQTKDKLRVGEISNMYTIYEQLKNPTKLITIG